MKMSFIKQIWFQSVVLLSLVFILCLWALNPISNNDLLENQKSNLSQLSDVFNGVVKGKLTTLNKELGYFVEELKNDKKEVIDEVDTSIKAVFELENEGQ